MNKLLIYINWLNQKAKAQMAVNPKLWVSMLTTDLEHWADYGIFTPHQLGDYLDSQCGEL